LNALHFTRVIEELCPLVGFSEPGILVEGGKLRVGDYLISFIFDEPYDSKNMFVYVDMGPLASNSDDTYKELMKINFELAAGTRGVLSIHPQTNHLFYAFCYPLDEASTGQYLLDSLTRFIDNIGTEALELPEEVKGANQASVTAGRVRASQLFVKPEHVSTRK
jgi:hypothetical protein